MQLLYRMNLLKRKPKSPPTPRTRYENDLYRMSVLGIAGGMGMTIAAYALAEMMPWVKGKAAEQGEWAFLGVVVIGLGLGLFTGLYASQVKKRLMLHAPPEAEIVGPMTEYRKPQS